MPLYEIKTATITEKGQIAIPKDVRNMKGFKVGSKIAIFAFENRIELRPMNSVSEKMEAAYASEKVLSKDWKSKEDDKAWKNL